MLGISGLRRVYNVIPSFYGQINLDSKGVSILLGFQIGPQMDISTSIEKRANPMQQHILLVHFKNKYLIVFLQKSPKTLSLALYQVEYNNSNSMYQKRMLVELLAIHSSEMLRAL